MSDNASNAAGQSRYPTSRFRFIDGLVLLVFIFFAFLGLYLFQQDLMRTFDMRDVEPAGTLIVRDNIVQRRHEDRLLWDRIFVTSPVYPGDVIRAADLSFATIDIDSNEISLNQNTLIRIQSIMGDAGKFQVELQEGNISVASGENSSGIMLNLKGSQVQTMSGSVLNVSSGAEGVSVQVNEGTVEFFKEGKQREISQGMMFVMDSMGVEKVVPAAVVRQPAPNARYLKNADENVFINFLWNRVNLSSGDLLKLEIAEDLNFLRGYRFIDDLENTAQADFDAGNWYWKLTFENETLGSGQLTVVDSSGPLLTSPAPDSVFRYHEELPQIRFQWTEKRNASNYIIEINDTDNFFLPRVKKRTTAASILVSELEPGTWYWRVTPVFTSNYLGDSSYSNASSFKIEKADSPAAQLIEVPQPVIAIKTDPVTVIKSGAIKIPGSSQRAEAAARQYAVQAGDTLGRIADRFYGDSLAWNRIAAANNITNPDLIYPGQMFNIP